MNRPTFTVIDVEPDELPPGNAASVRWSPDSTTAVLAIRCDLPLPKKLTALKWCASHLERHLLADGTGYWARTLKLVDQ